MNNQHTRQWRWIIAIVAVGVIALSVYLLVGARDDLPGYGEALFVAGMIAFGALVKLAEMRSLLADGRRAAEDAVRFTRVMDDPPVLLHCRVGLGMFRRKVELLAFYPDAVVLKRVIAVRELPDEVFTPRGAEVLANIPGTRLGRVMPLGDIDRIDMREAPTAMHGIEFVIRTVRAQDAVRFRPELTDPASCRRVLSGLYGARLHRITWTPRQRRRKRLHVAIAVCAIGDLATWMIAFFGHGHNMAGNVAQRIHESAGTGVFLALLVYLTLFWNGLVLFVAYRGLGVDAHDDD